MENQPVTFEELWPLWLGLTLFVSCTGAAFLIRYSSGKPFFAHIPANATYAQRWASGRSLKNLFTRAFHANNCLMVAVTPDRVVVQPQFPLSVLAPPFADLEHTIRRENVRRVSIEEFWFARCVEIEFAVSGATRKVQLTVSDPEALVRALRP